MYAPAPPSKRRAPTRLLPISVPAPLTDYEIKRQRQIAENQAKLIELGLSSEGAATAAEVLAAAPAPPLPQRNVGASSSAIDQQQPVARVDSDNEYARWLQSEHEMEPSSCSDGETSDIVARACVGIGR